jgi:hypothetical protein
VIRKLFFLCLAASGGVSASARQLPQAPGPTPPTTSSQTPQTLDSASLAAKRQSPVAGEQSAPDATPQPLSENLQRFDPDTLVLTWSNNRWLLSAGNVVLKDFGRKESEGRQAMRLARSLRLNQYATIGSPAPVMEYWLSDGRAPCGIVPGYPVVSFDADSLHVESAVGQWCVRDSRRVLFNFGSRPDDARQALAVLRKYGFSQVITVGQMTPSMFVFLANPSGDMAAASRPHHQLTNHETPEVAERKAEELKRLKDRFPDLNAETVAQPTLRPLRTPDQPRQAFTATSREFGGDGPNAAARQHDVGGADRGDRVPFDWRQVQVRLDGKEWRLAVGSLVLANFGPGQDAARRALDVIRYYHFTEKHLIGGGGSRFSYYLINGLAPRSLPFGIPSEPFEPDALQILEVEGQWAVCAGARPIIVVGERRDEAADLLTVIKRQHFDHLCRVGRVEDGFTFLVRTR